MARSRCTCTFHGNDMEMTVIPGNFQDKYGQTALQIYVFHLSFPATPPMLNLAYSKIRTCPHLQRSTKQTKRLSALIHIIYHPGLKFGFRPTKLQESCPELWNLDLVSQSSMKFHIVSAISRWTFSSPLLDHMRCWNRTFHHHSPPLQVTSWCWKVQPTVARHSGTPSENNLAHISPLYTGGTTLMDHNEVNPITNNPQCGDQWVGFTTIIKMKRQVSCNTCQSKCGFPPQVGLIIHLYVGATLTPWDMAPKKKTVRKMGKPWKTMELGETPQWNVLKWCRRNNQFSCLQHVDIARSGVCLSLNFCC